MAACLAAIRRAKFKIKENLQILERVAEEPYGAAGEKSDGQRLFKLAMVEKGKRRYQRNLARGIVPLVRFSPLVSNFCSGSLFH